MKKALLIALYLIGLQINAQTDSIKKTGWDINPKRFQKYTNNVLVVLENYKLNKDVLSALDSKKIVSVNVLKSEKAIAQYGNSGKDGVIEVTTKDYSRKEIKKLAQLYAFEYQPNSGKSFSVTGTVLDCEKMIISNVMVTNLNSKETTTSDNTGQFKISTKKNDVLLFTGFGLESKRLLVERNKPISIELKENPKKEGIIVKKPVIYLYPTATTDVKIQLDVKGKLLTTFPKYDNHWEVTANPNGQLFDKKTKRTYNSLFWDADVTLPDEHYAYQDGFIIAKERLTSFLIDKLEHIGLNTFETNEFVQFWLPILEKNEFNFIHFQINEDCNAIAELNVTPKPTTSIRIYMEFHGLEEVISIKEQELPEIERKGFTLVEWGGAEVPNNSKRLNNDN